MTVLSGKYGMVNGQSTIQNWVADDIDEGVDYTVSNSKAARIARSGVRDFTGRFLGKGGNPPAAVLPGKYFNFVGFTAPGTGARGAVGEAVSVNNVLATALEIRWNWQRGDILDYTVEFANGKGTAVTRNAAGNEVDATDPELKPVCPTHIDYGAGGAEIDWANLVEASLRIECGAVPYVNSSTSCFRHRRRGNLTCTATVTEQTTVPLWTPGSIQRFRFYVDAAEFWLLEYMQVKSFTNLNVDNDSGEVISQTVNMMHSAFDDDDPDTPTEGVITPPGAGQAYWPTDYIALTN